MKKQIDMPWVGLIGLYLLVGCICVGLNAFGLDRPALAAFSMFTGVWLVLVVGYWLWEWATPSQTTVSDEKAGAANMEGDTHES